MLADTRASTEISVQAESIRNMAIHIMENSGVDLSDPASHFCLFGLCILKYLG